MDSHNRMFNFGATSSFSLASKTLRDVTPTKKLTILVVYVSLSKFTILKTQLNISLSSPKIENIIEKVITNCSFNNVITCIRPPSVHMYLPCHLAGDV